MINSASLKSGSARFSEMAAGVGRAAAPGNNPLELQNKDKDDPALRKAFDSFVGETLFGQMLSSMRKTVHKSPYFNGGQAEKIFQGQLDQQLATEMAKASANTVTGPMYDLFMLNRK